ncbi:MAG: hypothetical protein GOV15_03325 [Candidatus Diapherotrites archaeon]|nr:hypothetical protein [Candidatus Diapherotrites archaeon]
MLTHEELESLRTVAKEVFSSSVLGRLSGKALDKALLELSPGQALFAAHLGEDYIPAERSDADLILQENGIPLLSENAEELQVFLANYWNKHFAGPGDEIELVDEGEPEPVEVVKEIPRYVRPQVVVKPMRPTPTKVTRQPIVPSRRPVRSVAVVEKTPVARQATTELPKGRGRTLELPKVPVKTVRRRVPTVELPKKAKKTFDFESLMKSTFKQESDVTKED